jgi:SAM-dependent methyltransferase
MRILVAGAATLHKPRVSDSEISSEIFARATRRRRRDRAAPGYAGFAFLREHMLEALLERLDAVKRAFSDVLDLGSFAGDLQIPGARIARVDAGFGFAKAAGGVQADEDRPPFADASFDLVVSVGVLDQVNDVPGALALARRVLRPDGLFLGAFVGAGTLATLRACLRDAERERPASRFHPQIDVRAGGDLLARAGFALPVADVETLVVRYAGLPNLLRDLRGMATTNLLPNPAPLTRDTLVRASAAFADRAEPDGRTPERFEIVYLTGWSPDPSQPKAARPGSATASLADALKPKRPG